MGGFAVRAAQSLPALGRAVLKSYASQAIGNLFAPDQEGRRYSELALQNSTEGAPIPVVYGRMRLAGQVIWAARFKEKAHTQSSAGGKGGGETTEYTYSVSFAVALCEGEIRSIGTVWANGEVLDLSTINYRVHTGGEAQLADPLMEAIEEAGHVPSYRGLAYIVFEDFPLDPYGQRIPNLSFEIIAGHRGTDSAPRMEDLIEGVCLIPASGEFAYSPSEVLRELHPGEDISENRHTLRAVSDIEAALDDLEARLPNCKSVALVTSWFGNDLRCGVCEIKPGVETRTKDTRPLVWASAGLNRSNAHLVSTIDDAPVYGGTPSDETVIATIKALKARGFAVTLYPLCLKAMVWLILMGPASRPYFPDGVASPATRQQVRPAALINQPRPPFRSRRFLVRPQRQIFP